MPRDQILQIACNSDFILDKYIFIYLIQIVLRVKLIICNFEISTHKL